MKLPTIQAYLQENGLDGWLLYSFWQQNPIALAVAGLQSGGSRRWFLWIPARGRPSWLIHAIESNAFVGVSPELHGHFHRYVGWKELADMLPRLVGGAEGRRLRIVMEYSPRNAIPYVSRIDAGIKELVEETTGAEIVSSAELAQLVQAVLSAQQLAGHRRVAHHCLAIKDAAFAYIGSELRAGRPLSEYDVQQFIEAQFAAAGLATQQGPICAVNANAANPHYAPSAQRHRAIRPGDAVLIDLWSREVNDPEDCYADITWTAYCGDRAPAKARHIFDIVAQARDRAVQFMDENMAAGRPVYGYEVDDACRQVIVEAGYGPHFIHRTGHSLGWMGHFIGANIDNLETQDRRRLIPGLLFTIEPGIYLPDFNFDDSTEAKGLGIRSEINCFVHSNRVEVTTLPRQTEIIPLM